MRRACGLGFLVLAYVTAVGACASGTSSGECAAPLEICGQDCVDSQTDERHCGGCSISCAAGEICAAGVCQLTCQAGLVICDGSCVDPQTDPNHCGAYGDCTGAAAGNVCESTESCIAGVCMLGCSPGDIICDGDCVDPQTDPGYCGASGDCTGATAGDVCESNESCVAGVCELGCPPGEIDCGGSCVDPQTDPDYCGASGDCVGLSAGIHCTASEACVAGVCEGGCAAGEIDCGGACVNPQTDPGYCGASGDCIGSNAGVVCGGATSTCPGAAAESCVAGGCVPGCAAGSQTFDFTGSIDQYALPACVVEISVVAMGAQGGSCTFGSLGGMGARVSGTICVPPGTTLSVLVGEQAAPANRPAGGGGGSFVVDGSTPLFVAGGGGGGYYDWAAGGAADQLVTTGAGVGGQPHNDAGGGGGFSTDGGGTAGSGGMSFLNGGAGGALFPAGNTNATAGGFGGGGGASQSSTFNAGGGGGYDGGNAGNGNASTGGTSFMAPSVTSPLFTPATRSGNGQVQVSW